MRLRVPRPSFRLAILAALAIVAASTALWLFFIRISTTPPPAPNYADDAAWLCRPARQDACATPTTATVFAPDGSTHVETYRPDPAAPIDCFYVYPTVSRARAAYAPIAATRWETDAARNQLARFGSVCRTFAPLYRQVTGRALPLLFAHKRGVTIDVPYADVRAAWKAYLARDNAGRGIVLIGHSQGARLLARLIAEEIDGKPAAARLVSAIIPGTRVDVPDGKRVGGTFRQTPLCASAPQTGCVIAYSSYPADRAMPPDSRFGVSFTPGMRYACVDPAAVDGTGTLDADLPLTPELKERYGTDFAALPGVLSASCKDDGPFSILAIAARVDSGAAARTKAMLDKLADFRPSWGLHAIDINLALGTLVDIVRKQTEAYARR